jgi:hypothetical protein
MVNLGGLAIRFAEPVADRFVIEVIRLPEPVADRFVTEVIRFAEPVVDPVCGRIPLRTVRRCTVTRLPALPVAVCPEGPA